ncbi:hypothetical protein ACO0LF_26145 [Undibacterium sp. Di27W]|uniref:hypothetical protein n=1 Tax=Undibacterium sp. Di27W TaxID=3413036 RepID=UPI003BF17402
MPIATFLATAALLASPAAGTISCTNTSSSIDAATLAAIAATCYDYIDGQLEADPKRVARSLHPDLAKCSVIGDTPDERLGLRRMSKEEMLGLVK